MTIASLLNSLAVVGFIVSIDQNIWEARTLLSLGCRWSIGDGSSIPNASLIRGLFDVVEAADILQVPLLEEVSDDKWNWKEEQNGVYSVRSGYRFWRKEYSRPACVGVDRGWSGGFVACFLRLFGYKAMLAGCSLSHIIDPRTSIFHDVTSFILDICSREDMVTAGRVAVMIDFLWKNRNNLIWNNESDGYSKLGLNVFCSWNEWFMAQGSGGQFDRNRPNLVWEPPVEGRIKCNVDAGFNSSRGTTNRDWCMRDFRGSFVCAGAAWDFCHYPILEAEALALKETIHSAINLQLESVIFESDSQNTVQAILSNHKGCSDFSSIISSIHVLLLNFPNFEVKFVKRQANSVAHAITKAADS
ncbi:uncharacterized protein LOC131648555 [Vicia villosa]|uniref:uncharacterized protein LOC131648555 n=1 Tax=Vicia villosa TaxID=3911 RepID=UPI00273B40DA|nr:uncharacterized protein LOC131648555 [Vicia villosa]